MINALFLDLPDEVDHLDGAQGAVVALVARLGAGALDGLLDVLGGEDAEEDGDTAVQTHGGDALGDLVAHVVVVAGGAPDDGAQADDGVVLAALGHLGGDEGDLEGAGHPGYVDVLLLHVVADQAVHGAAEELGGDELIEPGGHDAHPNAFGDQFSFQCLHFVCPPFNSAGCGPCAPAWS